MNTKKFTIIAMIAAVYTVVSLALAPISFGNIQVRIAEALVLLPLIYAPSIIGVTIGCFLTNLIGAMTGVNLLGFMDIFIGTFATLVAAILTYKFKENKIFGLPIISILAPVILNGIIIGIELGYVLFPTSFLIGSIISGLEVAAGELISVVIGYFIIKELEKRNVFEGI